MGRFCDRTEQSLSLCYGCVSADRAQGRSFLTLQRLDWPDFVQQSLRLLALLSSCFFQNCRLFTHLRSHITFALYRVVRYSIVCSPCRSHMLFLTLPSIKKYRSQTHRQFSSAFVQNRIGKARNNFVGFQRGTDEFHRLRTKS